MPLERIAIPLRVLPRSAKRIVVLFVDTVSCAIAVWLALALRLESWDVLFVGSQWKALVGAIVLAIPIFTVMGLYRALFRYGGWSALVALARAAIVYGVVYTLVFAIYGINGVPRTVGILQPMLFLLMVAASRAFARYWIGGVHRDRHLRKDWPRVLIYGAGGAGQQLARALTYGRKMWLIGFIDDDIRLQGAVVQGLPVYRSSELASRIAKLRINDILLAMPSISRKRRSQIVDEIREIDPDIAVRTLPALSDIFHGKVQVSHLRELDIADLLGRDPVPPNRSLLNRNIENKVVLVTGAGGSIGSELCRQILSAGPSRLLLIESSEYALYAINLDLRHRLIENGLTTEIKPLLASVCDSRRMEEIISAWRPDTVYHAAAYKHVPLVEHNAAEGIRNNIYGTLITAQISIRYGVKDFVLISTDKAVRPTNIMGASKRVAEMTLQALAASSVSHETRLCMVRFGNVLGSSGSVVPLFRQQIRDGGPLTLTDANITRYFMTIPEAAQLVVQAGAMASGGDVFVLDMGDPVKIIDLARRMVELSGMSVRTETLPDGDIEILETGLRPGEKLYEELLIGDNPMTTEHSRIMKAHERFLAWEELEPILQNLDRALQVNDVHIMREILAILVQDYRPYREIVDWVHAERYSKVEQIDPYINVSGADADHSAEGSNPLSAPVVVRGAYVA